MRNYLLLFLCLSANIAQAAVCTLYAGFNPNSYSFDGPTTCSAGKMPQLHVNGPLSLNHTQVEQLIVHGPVQAQFASAKLITVNGVVTSIGSKINSVRINGVFNSQNDELGSIYAQGVVKLNASQVAGEIVVSNNDVGNVDPEIYVLDHSIVKGNIRFTGQPGIVYLAKPAKLYGKIINGKIIETELSLVKIATN